MKDDSILSDIIYLFKAEETWNNSQEIHGKRYGREAVKCIFWYLIAFMGSLFLCCLTK